MESLTPGPELENSQGQKLPSRRSNRNVRLSANSGHRKRRQECRESPSRGLSSGGGWSRLRIGHRMEGPLTCELVIAYRALTLGRNEPVGKFLREIVLDLRV